jgi:hypothetical protein
MRENKTLLCTAVGMASHQRGFEACTAYGRFGNVLQTSCIKLPGNFVRFSFDSPTRQYWY